jgi:hypothetical protein
MPTRTKIDITSTMKTVFSWLLLAADLASCHLFISSPRPIEETAVKEPLSASGDNFPCHGVSLPTEGGIKMRAGSKQALEFDTGKGANTAVHGGGSCQVSISYESDPESLKDPQNWSVLYSIQGGCPSNTHQNLDSVFTSPAGDYLGAWPCANESTNGIDCMNAFEFKIPKGVRSGHAIMAWTWFNTVGNRHMFMNCINVDIEGGDGSEMGSLPGMFVANIGNGCETPENYDLAFPAPGRYLTTKLPPAQSSRTAMPYPTTTPEQNSCVKSSEGTGTREYRDKDQDELARLLPAESRTESWSLNAHTSSPETHTRCSS